MEYVPFGGKDPIKLNIAIIKNLIAVKTREGHTCSDNDAIKFMMMCKARLLNPFEGDAYLIGYDSNKGPTFSLITAHQAFLKRAEINPEYDGMKSGIIVEQDGELKDLEGDFYTKGQVPVGGWATVYFKNRKQPMHKRIRMERFKKGFGIWLDDPAGMICKCAEADALRSSFPTMLGGLYLKEEINPEKGVKTTAPIFSAPETAKAEPEVAEAVIVGSEPPEAPLPQPRPKVTPSKPEPAKPAPAAKLTPVEAMKQVLAKSGVSVEQILSKMRDIEMIGNSIETLEQMAVEEPAAFEMLGSDYENFIEDIKNSK